MGQETEQLTKSKLFLNENFEKATLFSLKSGEGAAFTSRCPGKETANEDAVGLFPVGDNALILAVADGVGGQRSGDKAAAIALKALEKSIKACESNGRDLRAAILDAFESANKAVLELGVGAATTLAVAEIDGRQMRPYHVGDSMIIAVGQKGKLKFQNISHSPVGYAVEAGVLDEKDAMQHEERHIVSNLIGSADMHIEIGSSMPLSAKDTVLLASDGLCDNLHTSEIVELSRKGSLDEVATRLIQDSNQRMQGEGKNGEPSKPDDLTFIAFRLSD